MNDQCNLDASIYENEIVPTLGYLNGARLFEETLPLDGDQLEVLYNPDKIRNLTLSGFVTIAEDSEMDFGTSASIPKLIASLERQINNTNGVPLAPNAIENNENLSVTVPSGNVFFIKPDAADITVDLGDQENGYEITFKRINGTGGQVKLSVSMLQLERR